MTKLRFNPRGGRDGAGFSVESSSTVPQRLPLVLYLRLAAWREHILPPPRSTLPSTPPPPPPLSTNFADRSPRRTIVSDRRDTVTKLIHRRYNTDGRRQFRFGARNAAKDRRRAFRAPVSFIKGKNDTLKLVASMCRVERTNPEKRTLLREARKNGTLINRRNAQKRLRDVHCNGSWKNINVTIKPQYFSTIKLIGRRKMLG